MQTGGEVCVDGPDVFDVRLLSTHYGLVALGRDSNGLANRRDIRGVELLQLETSCVFKWTIN